MTASRKSLDKDYFLENGEDGKVYTKLQNMSSDYSIFILGDGVNYEKSPVVEQKYSARSINDDERDGSCSYNLLEASLEHHSSDSADPSYEPDNASSSDGEEFPFKSRTKRKTKQEISNCISDSQNENSHQKQDFISLVPYSDSSDSNSNTNKESPKGKKRNIMRKMEEKKS